MSYQPFKEMMTARRLEQYVTSDAGGTASFNATTGVINLRTGGGTIGILQNPQDSGVDLYLSSINISADSNGRFERYRGGTITNSGNPVPSVNRGGGVNEPKCKLFGPVAATIQGGVLGKTQFLAAYSHDRSEEDGSIILRPGQYSYWTFVPDAALGKTTVNAAIEVVWWEQ